MAFTFRMWLGLVLSGAVACGQQAREPADACRTEPDELLRRSVDTLRDPLAATALYRQSEAQHGVASTAILCPQDELDVYGQCRPIESLRGQVQVAGRLAITRTADISALSCLREVGELHIIHNPGLRNLDALDGLKVGERLIIAFNPDLETLGTIPGGSIEPKRLVLLNNPELRGLGMTVRAPDASMLVNIARNDQLESLEGLHHDQRLIGAIEHNPALDQDATVSELGSWTTVDVHTDPSDCVAHYGSGQEADLCVLENGQGGVYAREAPLLPDPDVEGAHREGCAEPPCSAPASCSDLPTPLSVAYAYDAPCSLDCAHAIFRRALDYGIDVWEPAPRYWIPSYVQSFPLGVSGEDLAAMDACLVDLVGGPYDDLFMPRSL